MSTALAIASVTAVLKNLLDNGVINDQVITSMGSAVTVSAIAPDLVPVDANAPSRLNLFLYHVTPNQGWRNAALPSRDPAGARVSNPPLALDLHYLLTAYGASEFHAEILLGYGMQLLHETPVLTREAVRRALAPASPVTGTILPPPLDTLSASELADQVEQIRVTPQTMTSEEASKLWTAIQSHYRATVAYVASVVLIESRRSARAALPVAEDKRHIYVVPFEVPVIDQVVSASGDRSPIAVGSTLAIRGRNLRGDQTFVNLDGHELVPAAGAVTPARIDIPLTSPLPAGLYAGVKGVQVIHRFAMGDPPTDHRGFESNAAAFVLRPTITNGPVISGADVSGLVATTETMGGVAVALRAGVLTLALDPAVGRAQRVVLVLNELNAAPGTRPHAYSFQAPAQNGLPDGTLDSLTVAIPFARVVAGTYVVRVQVDGAESVPAQDGAGVFHAPRVALP
jgi:hypothetical protein